MVLKPKPSALKQCRICYSSSITRRVIKRNTLPSFFGSLGGVGHSVVVYVMRNVATIQFTGNALMVPAQNMTWKLKFTLPKRYHGVPDSFQASRADT
jgi:hypothetical protein